MISLIGLVVAAVLIASHWGLSRSQNDSIGLLLVTMVVFMFAIGVSSGAVQASLSQGYPNDSYWTLDLTGRIGVLTISSFGIAAMTLAFAAKSKVLLRWQQARPSLMILFADTALGLALFILLYSVSPQIFYSFYQMIFDGLPRQWVIQSVFDTEQVITVARLDQNGSLADHLAGLVFWAIIPFTGWLHLRHHKHL